VIGEEMEPTSRGKGSPPIQLFDAEDWQLGQAMHRSGN
jgi:hypothetical protein